MLQLTSNSQEWDLQVYKGSLPKWSIRWVTSNWTQKDSLQVDEILKWNPFPHKLPPSTSRVPNQLPILFSPVPHSHPATDRCRAHRLNQHRRSVAGKLMVESVSNRWLWMQSLSCKHLPSTDPYLSHSTTLCSRNSIRVSAVPNWRVTAHQERLPLALPCITTSCWTLSAPGIEEWP